jgi:arylsulfatase
MSKKTRSMALSILVLVFANLAQAQNRPNILIIWGDDIGPYNISAYNMGRMGYQTPNIDRIARGRSQLSHMIVATRLNIA